MIIIALLPSLLSKLIEKLTGKKINSTPFNTEVDESQGRGQGMTVYKGNPHEGGDKV